MILFVLLQLALDKSNLIVILSLLLAAVAGVLGMLQLFFQVMELPVESLDLGVVVDPHVDEELLLDIEVIF